MPFGKKKHLIIHDYFENFGGGERLVKVLHNTGIFDLVYGFKKNIIAKKIDINLNSFNLNKKKQFIIYKKFLLKKNFENLNIKKKYKTYFLSGNYSIFSNIKGKGIKIFYCHSLPKIFFEFNKFYNNYDIKKKIINLLYKKKFKKEYIHKLKSMDVILCNSLNIKKKIKKFTGLKAKVIYPPIEIKKFKWISQQNYFVSNNRHEIGKNLEKVINAFIKFPNLKIYFTSTGSQSNYLKKISNKYKNIIFTGFLDEKNYAILIGNCCGTINVTSNEDFGMAALEGLSAGKPALVINEGGYLETIKHKYNGFILDKNYLEKELVNFLFTLNFKELRKMKINCINSVKKYNSTIFIKKIKEIISK
jgi:glycosyltransferase involved in cell wall biosynthesis